MHQMELVVTPIGWERILCFRTNPSDTEQQVVRTGVVLPGLDRLDRLSSNKMALITSDCG